MGIINKITNGVTDKVGKKVLDIEEINEKDILPKNEEEIAQRREKAKAVVKKKSLLSSGMSVVPIDFGVDIKLMKDIIEDINKIYGLDQKQVNSLGEDVKERILSAAAIQGSSMIGEKVTSGAMKLIIRDVAKRTAAKQTKWFPIVGQAVSASISYYFMNKLGQDHIEKCEKVLRDII